MKHLKSFENFKQNEYTVGDLVKLNNDQVAKIKKINTGNSYIVNIMNNSSFVDEPIEVRDEASGGLYIVELIKGINEPVYGAELNLNPSTNPSNDLVINT